jgi:hypothetical protein
MALVALPTAVLGLAVSPLVQLAALLMILVLGTITESLVAKRRSVRQVLAG